MSFKKTEFGSPITHLSALPDSYIPFEAFLSGIFVYLPTHYIASKSLEIFEALPNNWLNLIRKLSLIHS